MARPRKPEQEKFVAKNIRFPRALIAELEALVPAGERSRFIQTELARGLKRERRKAAGRVPKEVAAEGEKRAASETTAAGASHCPIWEDLLEIADAIPEEDLAGLPTDLAAQHDHYIYGTPKR